MAAVTICVDFREQENEIWHCFHIFPIFAMKGKDCMSRSYILNIEF